MLFSKFNQQLAEQDNQLASEVQRLQAEFEAQMSQLQAEQRASEKKRQNAAVAQSACQSALLQAKRAIDGCRQLCPELEEDFRSMLIQLFSQDNPDFLPDLDDAVVEAEKEAVVVETEEQEIPSMLTEAEVVEEPELNEVEQWLEQLNLAGLNRLAKQLGVSTSSKKDRLIARLVDQVTPEQVAAFSQEWEEEAVAAA